MTHLSRFILTAATVALIIVTLVRHDSAVFYATWGLWFAALAVNIGVTDIRKGDHHEHH